MNAESVCNRTPFWYRKRHCKPESNIEVQRNSDWKRKSFALISIIYYKLPPETLPFVPCGKSPSDESRSKKKSVTRSVTKCVCCGAKASRCRRRATWPRSSSPRARGTSRWALPSASSWRRRATSPPSRTTWRQVWPTRPRPLPLQRR